MSTKSKYVIFFDRLNNRPEAVIFSSNLIHSDVTRHLQSGMLVPVSAGFVDMGTVDGRPYAQVYGRSDSLSIDGHPEDSVFVMQTLGLAGLVEADAMQAAVNLKKKWFAQYGT